MTEKQLRQKCADIINKWIGAQKGDAIHAEILRIYNGYKPLARGYPVQPKDDYCATGASACYIQAGIAKYTGTECGVEKWVQIAKEKGIWVENDAHRPGVGDAAVYDWDDNGVGDCTGYSDHVGIVVAVSGDAITVTECNINGGKIGQRVLMVNARYIRGFICPDFAQIAVELDPDTPIADDVETPLQACTVTLPVLRQGSRGGYVKTLQHLLKAYGGYEIGADGVFGSWTDTTVRKYQRARNLTVDGIVGAQTWGMLLR